MASRDGWMGPKRRGVRAKMADADKPSVDEVLAAAKRRRAFDRQGQAGIPAGQRNAFGPAMPAPAGPMPPALSAAAMPTAATPMPAPAMPAGPPGPMADAGAPAGPMPPIATS
jgi:hypothetical protein